MTISRQEVQAQVNAEWTAAAELFAGEVLIECLRRYLGADSDGLYLVA